MCLLLDQSCVFVLSVRWHPGEQVTLNLVRWADVESKYGTINRRELEDDALLTVEPCWGESAK